MQIPREFEKQLENAYRSKAELDRLFIEQKHFILRLVKNAANKHRHWAIFSDEDDLYQEACIWIVNSMWDWDEDKGPSLARYVCYNVGVRLRNYLKKEEAKTKRPSLCPKEFKYSPDDREGDKLESRNTAYDEAIEGNIPDPESLLVIRNAYISIEKELPLLARELLEALMLEDGNFTGASRRLLRSGRVRRARGMSFDAFRQSVHRTILPQLRTILIDADIIQSTARL